MKISLILDFDRPIGLVHRSGLMTVRCTAEVWREYDRLHLRDFEADETLSLAETEAAKDRLLDFARYYRDIRNTNADEMRRLNT